MNLDKFYTKKEVAQECWDIIKSKISVIDFDIILEPSAGNGSFFNLFPKNKRLGIDIKPDDKNIRELDFFNFKPESDKKYLVVGNPPFGRSSSKAISFFNKASTFCDCIAFILPRTFKRISVQNKISLDFHLIYSKDLPLKPCCFEPEMNAKCCFQIWKKTKGLRNKTELKTTHDDFVFLKYGEKDYKNQPTPPKGSDFAIKAYGSNCGEIIEAGLKDLRPKSWHFIKSNIDVYQLIDNMKKLDFSVSKDTVRQDSLGKGDLVYLYTKSL